MSCGCTNVLQLGSTADGVLNGATVVGNVLTLTTSVGGSFPVTLPSVTNAMMTLAGTVITLTDTLGGAVTVDLAALNSTLTAGINGDYTHVANGVTTVIETAANTNPFDPANSDGLTATNVQAAIDELAAVNEGWRIVGAAGANGAQAEPTRDDALSVSDDLQHLGSVLLGGTVGMAIDAVTPIQLHVEGSEFISSDNSRPLVFHHPTSQAADQRFGMIHRFTDATDNGYIGLRPLSATNGSIKGGWFVDRLGNVGVGFGVETHVAKGGSEQVYSDIDNPGFAPQRTVAPAAAWSPNYTHKWTKSAGGFAEYFVMDSAGNVTQLSSHSKAVADLLNLDGMAYSINSYNIYSGVGEGVDPVSGRKVVYDIDDGAYDIEEADGTISSSGVNDELAFGKNTHAPLSAIGYTGERGAEFWAFSEGMYEKDVKTRQDVWDKFAEDNGNEQAIIEFGERPKDFAQRTIPSVIERTLAKKPKKNNGNNGNGSN